MRREFGNYIREYFSPVNTPRKVCQLQKILDFGENVVATIYSMNFVQLLLTGKQSVLRIYMRCGTVGNKPPLICNTNLLVTQVP